MEFCTQTPYSVAKVNLVPMDLEKVSFGQILLDQMSWRQRESRERAKNWIGTSFSFLVLVPRRHDTQHNDTQHNDIQHNDTQNNDSKTNSK